MNVLPSSSRLLEVVRKELTETVTPIVADEAVRSSLAMIDEILRFVSVRCDHEIRWMVEEVWEITAAATALVDRGDDADGAVATALSSVPDPLASLATADVSATYGAASTLLSTCVEVALPIGGASQAEIEALLQRRLAHEAAIRGDDFTLVARG